ncbi:hypothetical protein LTR97_006656 [Elasticomyces elasticus]|uniref:PLD phosphodiesterase domain-containing protein n=1 Tax=Elasticomyces elasticus TaxID=574655 RepID=A0AAN7WA85_9PEZI|nr:hypothetical protein LTR97_006656 [Elasticomyces elasticus]
MDTSTDSEDEDVKAAIALSLCSDASTAATKVTAATSTTPDYSTDATKSKIGFAGLDRKAMEAERLARQTSRKRNRERSISPPGSRKAPKLESTTVHMPSGARLTNFSTIVQQDQSTRKSDIANAANANLKAERRSVPPAVQAIPIISTPRQGGLTYPTGVVKKTWAFGHERTTNDIKLEEVLEPQTLRTAVLSAFQWDVAWVMTKLKVPPNGGSTKCIFVMQAKDEAMQQQMMKETEEMRSFLRLCFPPMPGAVRCMHSKLMLLFHPQKLRVAVPSANLLNFDWGAVTVSKQDLTFFGAELLYFLEQQGINQDVRDGILKFDFSATTDMAFVHTSGGTFYGDEAERTGLPGLSRAVRHLGLRTDDLHIDFAASSIGSLNDDFLRTVHSAAKGDDLIASSKAAVSKAKANFFKSVKPAPITNIREQIRLYFPTRGTVQNSTAGSAGTICLSRQWFENMPFPRVIFRDYVSTRTGLLSHNKILYARGKQKLEGDSSRRDVAWVYVGAANMSESAWGRIVYDKKTKDWKINCNNWECGVLLPVPSEKLSVKPSTAPVKEEVLDDGSETESEDEGNATSQAPAEPIVGMDVFNGLVDPPFEFPGRTFDGKEPWYFKEARR